jgi:glycosyltransferase involved in cell wall biosynthesis
MGTSLSLVVPAYNEADRLGAGLKTLMEGISSEETEIVVVDDGSTDGTADVARDHLASWPQHEVVSLDRNCGKGAAVRAGVARARGEIIAYIDADMATDPRDLGCLTGALQGNHLAVGSRAHQGSEVNRELHRRAMNWTFGTLVSRLTQLPYMDTQCGFKAFKGSIAKLLFHCSRVERFAFDVEVLDMAARLGLRMEEAPVHWTDVPGSHVRPVGDSFYMLRDVVRNRLTWKIRRPIRGVFIPGVTIDMANISVKPFVRRVDLMLEWEGGTAILLPCVPPMALEQACKRLMVDLNEYLPQTMCVEFGELFSPISTQALQAQELAV